MINQGVSDSIRGSLWMKLLEINQAMACHSDRTYASLLRESNLEIEKQIEKDIQRTMAELNLWREDSQAGNNKLFNVLKAYANYDSEVCYVQSMNYIAGLLLFYIDDEEKVFWCLQQVMQRRQWREVYTHDFPKLKKLTGLLEYRLQEDFPEVLAHL